jgi:hypothetical protein
MTLQDPEERRKQRRLAKNRVTAARSRERKKEQMADLSTRLGSLESDNHQLRDLLATLIQENTSLKEQLASLTRGAISAALPIVASSAAVTEAVLTLPVQQQTLLLPVKTEILECSPSPEPAVLNRCLAIMHLVCWLLVSMAVETSLRGVFGVFTGWLACQQRAVGSATVATTAAAVMAVAAPSVCHKQVQAGGQIGCCGRTVAGVGVAGFARGAAAAVCLQRTCKFKRRRLKGQHETDMLHSTAVDVLDGFCAAGAGELLRCSHQHTAAIEVLQQHAVAVAA